MNIGIVCTQGIVYTEVSTLVHLVCVSTLVYTQSQYSSIHTSQFSLVYTHVSTLYTHKPVLSSIHTRQFSSIYTSQHSSIQTRQFSSIYIPTLCHTTPLGTEGREPSRTFTSSVFFEGDQLIGFDGSPTTLTVTVVLVQVYIHTYVHTCVRVCVCVCVCVYGGAGAYM